MPLLLLLSLLLRLLALITQQVERSDKRENSARRESEIVCHHTPTVTGQARDTNTTIATFHSINNNKSGVDLQSAHTSQIGYSHEHDVSGSICR